MRILMLTQFYPPIIGGEEQHVRNLSHALVARGQHVAIATLSQPGLPELELDEGVVIYRIRSTAQRAAWLFTDSERPHASPAPDLETMLGLRAVLAREKPDVVHAHNWLLHSFLPLNLLRHQPFVVTLHDYSLDCAQKRLMNHGATCSGPGLAKCLGCAAHHYGLAKGTAITTANWTMGSIERRVVDMFLAVSEATARGNRLAARGLPYRVLANFVPDELASRPEPFDARLIEGLPQEFVLFVGDLSHDKGVDVLLSSYAQLSSPPPLVLIGRQCADTPRRLPDNVSMFYKWPHGAVMQAWRRSLFALVPSTVGEACGTVALEAMSAGRAVIASDIGGLPDLVVHDETGLLVKPNNVSSLQMAMQRVLADPALRDRLGQAGRERVRQFSASAIVPQIEGVYREVIQRKRDLQRPRKSRAPLEPETTGSGPRSDG